MNVKQAVYEAMIEQLVGRDEKIDRLRAEVKRRGEMLKKTADALWDAKEMYETAISAMQYTYRKVEPESESGFIARHEYKIRDCDEVLSFLETLNDED